MWNLPQFRLPGGFWIRTFRPGDEWDWARVEASAAEFGACAAARDHFEQEFGGKTDELGSRCHFLLTPQGRIIGTATAWYGHDVDHTFRGRLHWVGIEQEYQGRRLAKPLVSAVMNRLARLHRSVYLTTQTTSFKAIKVYLDFGFLPRVNSVEHLRGWKLMADLLKHPSLERYR
jgi:GNAT superfamily N-acetyltransferase